MSTKPRKDYNPGTFRSAFEAKYRSRPADITIIVMTRFAARVCQAIDTAVVKGGLGLEMRLDTPRATKDADLIISGSHDLGARLSEAGRIDLGDFLRYSVIADRSGATINAPGLAYAGQRYKVQARFGSGMGPWPGDPFRTFAAEISIRHPAGFDIFHSGFTEFPTIPLAPVRVYSLPWQISEKVHAYTDPRHRETTNPGLMRPRDLLDMCRCARATTKNARIEGSSLRDALEQTFVRRKQAAHDQHVVLQDLPRELPTMPPSWEEAFQRQVQSTSLPWRTSSAAHEAAARFLDPILGGAVVGAWDPAQQRWLDLVASDRSDDSQH